MLMWRCIQDSVFEFEKKRNVPVKYDRELWTNTVRAMKRIAEIRRRRESQYIKNRLRVGRNAQLVKEMSHIEKNVHLIKAPLGKIHVLYGLNSVSDFACAGSLEARYQTESRCSSETQRCSDV